MAWNQRYSRRTGQPVSNGAAAKQHWAIGDAVRVGFIAGLTVIAKVPTPGDYAPDAWVLQQRGTGRIYRFVPHHGLERCENLEEAMR